MFVTVLNIASNHLMHILILNVIIEYCTTFTWDGLTPYYHLRVMMMTAV